MWRRVNAVAVATGVALLAACSASNPSATNRRAPAPQAGIQQRGAGTIIPGAVLRGSGVSLIDALAGRVSNMQVDRRSNGRCPVVALRGTKTIIGNPNPAVYVDRTPMTDTCVLDQIRVTEVERVEIYVSGVSGRPEYRSSPHGLILVFMTGGPQLARVPAGERR